MPDVLHVDAHLALHLDGRGHRRDVAFGVLAEADHQASCDPLTGLVNRRILNDRLAQSLARAQRHRVPPVVFFCDIDGFKAVNDQYGHEVGDQVLTSLADALTAVVRPQDTVARLGGDEFVVLCEGLPEDRTGSSASPSGCAGRCGTTTALPASPSGCGSVSEGTGAPHPPTRRPCSAPPTG